MKSHLNRPEFAKKALAADICDYLNELLEADSSAVRSLFDTRVPCNCALEMHPTAQVGPDGVGFLGIINGLIGVDSSQWGYIEGIYADGVLQSFSARHPEGDMRMAPGVAVSGRSCEACKLEAQIGTEEVPHPIDARLHTCKVTAPIELLPNQPLVYQQLAFPVLEEATGVEEGELFVVGAPPKHPRTPGIFAAQLQRDLEQARAEEDAAAFEAIMVDETQDVTPELIDQVMHNTSTLPTISEEELALLQAADALCLAEEYDDGRAVPAYEQAKANFMATRKEF